MTIFRPSNINKRLGGTSSSNTLQWNPSLGSQTGSPGNGGQIGPTKTPYCVKGVCCASLTLGQRYFGTGGGSCGGMFRLKESFCGAKEKCSGTFTDCRGIYISTGWWLAPADISDINATGALNWKGRSTAACCACAALGNCSWFIPTNAQAQNPGYTCRTYWDSYDSIEYWTNETINAGQNGYKINMTNGGICNRQHNHFGPARAFRN